MPRVILGIDPGIADTGFGVIAVEGLKLNCLAYGSIRTAAGEIMTDRLFELSEGLDLIIKKYQPELVAVEQLFFCKNAKTALIVGQARGVVLLEARKNNLEVVEFTPLQVKQAVSSYGLSDKKQVQKMVKLLLGLNKIPKPDDAADALAIAICAVNFLKK